MGILSEVQEIAEIYQPRKLLIMNLNAKDAQDIIAVMNRANITGVEAPRVAELVAKLAGMVKATPANMVVMDPEDEGTTITA